MTLSVEAIFNQMLSDTWVTESNKNAKAWKQDSRWERATEQLRKQGCRDARGGQCECEEACARPDLSVRRPVPGLTSYLQVHSLWKVPGCILPCHDKCGTALHKFLKHNSLRFN